MKDKVKVKGQDKAKKDLCAPRVEKGIHVFGNRCVFVLKKKNTSEAGMLPVLGCELSNTWLRLALQVGLGETKTERQETRQNPRRDKKHKTRQYAKTKKTRQGQAKTNIRHGNYKTRQIQDKTKSTRQKEQDKPICLNKRQDKTRQGKARQGKARQGKARQGKAKARQDKYKTRQIQDKRNIRQDK
jgi:hypothetical protein